MKTNCSPDATLTANAAPASLSGVASVAMGRKERLAWLAALVTSLGGRPVFHVIRAAAGAYADGAVGHDRLSSLLSLAVKRGVLVERHDETATGFGFYYYSVF